MTRSLTAIYRARAYSPYQHADNDRLILDAVLLELQRRGFSTRTCTEEAVGRTALEAPVILSMCQGDAANQVLQGLEGRGVLVVNSPRGVQACYRQRFYPARRRDAILPRTTIVATSDGQSAWRMLEELGSVWIKRGDVHQTQAGDVVRVTSAVEGAAVLHAFARRGIGFAAIQEHIPGLVVKFYGVVGTGFFRWYAEHDQSLVPRGFGELRPRIERLVLDVGLDVYGGDAVIRPDGSLAVIDINDWPSFAPFRRAAAVAIGDHVARRVAAVEQEAGRWASP